MQRQDTNGLGSHAHAHLQQHQLHQHDRLASAHAASHAYTHAHSADLGLGSGAYSPYLLPVLGVVVIICAVLIFIALGLLSGKLPAGRYLYQGNPQWALPDCEGVDSDYEPYSDDPSASSSRPAKMKVLVATYPYTGHFNPAKPVVEELLRRGHEVVWMTGLDFKDKVLKTGARFAPMSDDALVDDDNIHRMEGKVTLTKMADYLRRLFIARIPAQVNDYHRVIMGTEAAEAAGIPRYIPPHPTKGDDLEEANEEYIEPEDLPPFAADLLVVDFCTYAARCYMDLTGTPYATLGINPLVTLDPEIPPWGSGLQPPTTRWGLMGIQLMHYMGIIFFISRLSSEFNKVRRQLGLPPRSRWRSYADDVRSPDLHIQMTTPMFEFPRKNMLPSVTFVGPLLPTWQAKPAEENSDPNADKSEDWPTPSWWDEMLNHPRERVVHITQGTISVNTDLLVKPTIEALAGRDDLLLIITGKNVENMFAKDSDEAEEGLDKNDDDEGTVVGDDSVSADGSEPPAPKMARPANVRTAPFVPHLRLLPHVGVMVTNAGYNGTLTALSCGVPLVCAGRSEDKADVSSRVAWSGAGIDLGTAAPSADAVRAAVLRIVEAGLGTNSRRNSAAISNLESDAELAQAMANIDKIHGPEHNYRAAAKHIRDDFAQHNPPVEAADALEQLVIRKKTGRRMSLGQPRRSSLKAPKLNRPN